MVVSIGVVAKCLKCYIKIIVSCTVQHSLQTFLLLQGIYTFQSYIISKKQKEIRGKFTMYVEFNTFLCVKLSKGTHFRAWVC